MYIVSPIVGSHSFPVFLFFIFLKKSFIPCFLFGMWPPVPSFKVLKTVLTFWLTSGYNSSHWGSRVSSFLVAVSRLVARGLNCLVTFWEDVRIFCSVMSCRDRCLGKHFRWATLCCSLSCLPDIMYWLRSGIGNFLEDAGQTAMNCPGGGPWYQMCYHKLSRPQTSPYKKKGFLGLKV